MDKTNGLKKFTCYNDTTITNDTLYISSGSSGQFPLRIVRK